MCNTGESVQIFVRTGHTSRRMDVMAIKNEIVDELLKGAGPKKVFSSEGLLAEIKKALAERMLNADFPQADGRNN